MIGRERPCYLGWGFNRVLSAGSRTHQVSSVPMIPSADHGYRTGLTATPSPTTILFHLTLVAEYSKFSWRFLRQIKQVQIKVTDGD